jgi:rubrerythrin
MEPDAALLAQYLKERDVPCPGCGYNLQGITTEKCPECCHRQR